MKEVVPSDLLTSLIQPKKTPISCKLKIIIKFRIWELELKLIRWSRFENKILKNLFSDNAPTLTPRDHYLRTTRYLPGTVTRIQPQNNNNNNGAQSPLNIPIQGSRRQNSLKSSKFIINMFVYLPRWRMVSVKIKDRKIDFVRNCKAQSMLWFF